MTPEAIAYEKHKNLKIAAQEIGIKWQTLYLRLKNQGIAVIGDKLRYGSDRDKLSAKAEAIFKEHVPSAVSMNDIKWQHKHDFEVNGFKVDVKCSMKRRLSSKYQSKSWAFSFKKQTITCDFVCCFCLDDNKEVENVLLVPSEFFKGLQTVSVASSGNSKWLDYSVDICELEEFFMSLNKPAQGQTNEARN